MNFSRRNFFALAAASAIDWRALMAQEKTGMNVLSKRPEDLEMPLSGFSDYLTPIEHFFVRTHVYVPTVESERLAPQRRWRGRDAPHPHHGRA